MICKYCGNDYSIDFFGVALTTPEKVYRRRKCKFCYSKTKDILRSKIKEEIQTFKTSKGCSKCPENDHRALDFHHTRDKLFTIGDWRAVVGSGRKKIWKEIEKCVILCANCHRKEHSNERKV